MTFINFPFFFFFRQAIWGSEKESHFVSSVFLKAKDECPGKEPCQTPQGHGMLGI